MLDCVAAMHIRHAVWNSGRSSWWGSSGHYERQPPRRHPQVLAEWWQGTKGGCQCWSCTKERQYQRNHTNKSKAAKLRERQKKLHVADLVPPTILNTGPAYGAVTYEVVMGESA